MKLHQIFIYITLGIILMISSTHAKPSKTSAKAKKIQSVLANYIKQYKPLINLKAIDKKIEFKEKKHQAILQSDPISQKAFYKQFPQLESIKASLINYLLSKKFKQVKECLHFDPAGEMSAMTWKKGRRYIHYTFSYTTDPKTHDQLDQITFFTKDLCGKN